MSDTSTTPEAVETEPEVVAPDAVVPEAESAETTTPVVAAPPVRRTRAKAVVVEPDGTAEAVPVTDAAPDTIPATDAEPEAVAAAPSHQIVYVEAPKPFIAKSNRGFGVLIAVLSTVIYALVYAGILAVIELAVSGALSVSYLSQAEFWTPVGAFLVGFVILVLIVNRAGWGAHVLGSLLVGAFVYFVSGGVILLFHLSQIPSNQGAEFYKATLLTVGVIVAGLLAREVALWMGFAVAARGRKVRARNVEARAVYDQEVADKKAEYEAGTASAA